MLDTLGCTQSLKQCSHKFPHISTQNYHVNWLIFERHLIMEITDSSCNDGPLKTDFVWYILLYHKIKTCYVKGHLLNFGITHLSHHMFIFTHNQIWNHWIAMASVIVSANN